MQEQRSLLFSTFDRDGVITAGDPIMVIVPATDTLLAEVKVDPAHCR